MSCTDDDLLVCACVCVSCVCVRFGQDGPPGSRPPGMGLPVPTAGKGSYVPPSLRGGRGAGDRMADDRGDRRRDDNSVRVSNLSEDATEQDLQVGGLVVMACRCALVRPYSSAKLHCVATT